METVDTHEFEKNKVPSSRFAGARMDVRLLSCRRMKRGEVSTGLNMTRLLQFDCGSRSRVSEDEEC